LSLGPIDDVDRAYVNGLRIGKTEEEEQWQKDRIYTVAKDIVTDSSLTLAVRVIDYGGGGGMYGDRSKMTIRRTDSAERVSVAGSWKYLPVAEFQYSKFYVYGARGERFYARPKTAYSITSNSPAVLYNAMIAPTLPYTIKGAIWYQGESNTTEPRLYRELLPLMIRNWREDWNEGEFPFYFVQIPPYNYGDSVQSQVLRESQLLTLATPRTGMVVTLDIGETNNIHPADKQSVGERLARWALAKDYRMRAPFSGPLYRSMKIEGDSIVVSFDHAEKGLLLKENGSNGEFLIAGEDRRFVTAEARVAGRQLILHSALVKNPVSVRYAWSNTASATLFNVDGLPASSFRTDDWEN
jgi:sialate O-acetylesterase